MTVDTSLWANIFVDELTRAGVSQVCIAPGSRSTPLALAMHAHTGLQTYTLIDERSAAFFALGLSMTTGKPVAVLTTSGTAVANLLPAILEARQSGHPLIILTADRPHELRHSGTNQSIDQVKIFGGSVKDFFEAPLPENEPSERILRYLRTLADRTVMTATHSPAGPVHVNFPFRKPLEPLEHEKIADTSAGFNSSESPFTEAIEGQRSLTRNQIERIAGPIQSSTRGLFVLGPNSHAAGFIQDLIQVSKLMGFPILADPLSGARFSPAHKEDAIICGAYDWYLKDYSGPAPDFILRIGQEPTSANLQQFLEDQKEAMQIGFRDSARWPDSTHRLSMLVDADPRDVLTELKNLFASGRPDFSKDAAWTSWWSNAETVTWEVVSSGVVDQDIESGLVSDLVSTIPDRSLVFSANSLPIRHLDQFGRPRDAHLEIFGNRGVSGIDGTLSSAAGVAASGKSVTILIGDLAFHHDQTGLLALQKYANRATVVLLNNHGGGIFKRLPIAQYEPPFQALFQTPIDVDFSYLTKAYGGAHMSFAKRSELLSEIKKTDWTGNFRVLEYESDINLNEQNYTQIKNRLKEKMEHD